MATSFRIGRWIVQPRLNVLSPMGDGASSSEKTVHLEPRAMEVLVYLAVHAGQMVSKEDLFQQVWKGAFVTDEALTNCISILRKSLGDDARNPQYIQTIPKKGYRLIAQVWLEGTEPAPSVLAEPPSRRALALACLGVLVSAGGYVTLRNRLLPSEPPASIAETKGIVVLPFEYLGPEEHEYFAAGISDEITSRLAAVHQLQVISRKSAMHYAKLDKPLKEIGEELDVDYVLEGSVRWGAKNDGTSQVRITPQLIRVSDDTHLWSESYDRELHEVIEVQSDIAEQVIQQLGIRLFEPERRALDAHPTENVDAYHAYLRGLDHLSHPDYLVHLPTAVQLFERAVKLDPGFALAHAKLSEAQAMLYFFDVEPLQERRSQAKKAADRALELSQDLPQAHIAMGNYHYRAARNYELALEEFRIAQAGLPNDAEVFANIGYIVRRQGEFEDAVAYLKKALELNPHSASAAVELAETLGCLRRYEEAARYADHSISLLPDQARGYLLKARILWLWEGATEKARAVLEAVPDQQDKVNEKWYLQELFERNYHAALDRLSDAPELLEDWPKSLLEELPYRLLNEPTRARDSAEAARMQLEKMIKEKPESPYLHSGLGLAYASLGRREVAIREGQRAVELLPISEDALEGPFFVELLSHIYTLVGDHETALDELEHLLSIPAGHQISAPLLRIDPRWDELRHLPRFQRLLEGYE